MIGRNVLLPVAAAMAFCANAWAQPTRPPGSAGTGLARAAPAPAGAFDDRWMGQMALTRLEEFAATGEYDTLAERLHAALVARVACGHLEELGALTEMVHALRACALLPKAAATPGGQEMVRWLVGHKDVSQILFRAMGDVPEPAESLKVFWELVRADEKAVLSHPDLAAAFATSRPMRHYRPQPDPCTMVEAFGWYTHPAVRMRFDLKKMPYELARYLATSRLSLPERRWAAKAYGGKDQPVKAYFDLEYDLAAYELDKPKKIADKPYTLPNLRKEGGVCIEQAYYAAEICRALGIPAAIASGTASWGGKHAWAACLRIGGNRAYWDSTTGRYEAHRYYTGQVSDPANGRAMPDAELMLVGAAAQLPRQRRREADAAVVLARLVDKLRDKSPAVDLDLLRRWARDYDEHPPERAKRPPASVAWLAQKRQLDGSLVEDLLAEAIERNLAFRPAWELLVKLRTEDRLPAEHLDRFFDTLISKTAKDYPDYSCSLVMRIVPTIADAAARENVYRRSLSIYGERPDLQGWILISLGDDYAKHSETDKALKAYEAALKSEALAEVMLAASERAEKALKASGRAKAAITMYTKLIDRAKRRWRGRDQKAVVDALRARLAALLREAGLEREAERV